MADQIDFGAIGKTLKQQYPAYQNYTDETLGQLYVKKYRPADYASAISQQSAEIDLGKQVTAEKAKRAVDYSPEAIQQEADKTIALQSAKDKAEADKKTKEADLLKQDIVSKARALADVIEQGKSGKLKGKQYEAAYRFAASNYAASRGFQEGGKALTGPELAQLAGSMPRTKQQNFIDQLLGNPPTGEVVDNVDDLYLKTLNALKSSSDPKDRQRANKALSQLPQGDNGLLQNAGQDIKGILNGLLGLGGQVATGKFINPADSTTWNPQALKNTVNTAVQGSKATVNEYNDLLGRPTEGGDIVGRILQHAQQHPVNTALDVLPFLQAGKVGMAGKAVGDVGIAGEAGKAGESAGLFSKTGSSLRGQVRQIDAGPMVGGPQKEAAINATLDQLGIKGSPQQQYAQLQPVMTKLEDNIHAQLEAEPKTVLKDQIRDDIMRNLKQELPERTITDKQAKQAINTYLGDIYGEKLGENISTADLFAKKQAINASYQRIQKKINLGQPLTPKEEVTVVVRKAIDDIIAEKHPNVKQMTLQQSRLFDAADSLYKQRGNQMRVRLPFVGNYVPAPSAKIRGGVDALGRILQR